MIEEWILYAVAGGVFVLAFYFGVKWHEDHLRQFFLIVDISGPLIRTQRVKIPSERWTPKEVMSGVGVTGIDKNGPDEGRMKILEQKVDQARYMLEETYQMKLSQFLRQLEMLLYG